jgi:hypothetical protein
MLLQRQVRHNFKVCTQALYSEQRRSFAFGRRRGQ